MKLKKSLINFPFYNIKEYKIMFENEIDLLQGIVNICEILFNNCYIIQVFKGDNNLNTILKIKSNDVTQYKNFNYYYVNDTNNLINILYELDWNNIRYLDIYSVSNFSKNFEVLKSQLSNFKFEIGLDNYFEYAILKIDITQYSKDIIKKITK